MTTALRELLLEFGIDVDDRQLQVADRSIANTVQGVHAGLQVAQQAAQAVIGVVRGVAEFIGDTLAMGDALADAANAAGMTTDAFQLLGFIAGQSGVEASQLTAAVTRLQRAAVAGARGSGELGRVFRQLGVDVHTATGQFKDGPTLFREVGLALANIEDTTLRAALAQQVFGRSGTAIAGIFADGAEGIDALTARFAELGGGLSSDFARKASQARDAMAQLDLAVGALKSEIVITLVPAIRDTVHWLSSAVGFIVRAARQTRIFEAITIALGGALAALAAIAAWWSPMLVPWLLIAAGFIAVTLAVEDLLVFFQGGKSVVGRFLDAVLGVGSSKAVLESVRQTIRDISAAFEVAKVVAVAAWKQINGAIVEFIATNETARTFVDAWVTGFRIIWNAASEAISGIVGDWSEGIDELIGRITGLDARALFGQARAAQDAERQRAGTHDAAAVAARGPLPAWARNAAPILEGFSAGIAPITRPAAVTAQRSRGRRAGPRVDARTSVVVHANAASAREVGHIVDQRVRAAQDRALRTAVAALEARAPRGGGSDDD